MLASLPYEILLRISAIYFEEIPRSPLSFLLVNSAFLDIGQCILHQDLQFLSIHQMEAMRQTCSKLAYPPRTLSIKLAGGASDYRVFRLLHGLLQLIRSITPDRSQEKTQLELQRVQLCLNSYMSDPRSDYVQQALALVNPYEFVWTGPDPAHHFSIAIVPKAAVHLFGAIQSWTNLRHLKLTNIAFPVDRMGLLAQGLGVSPRIAALFRTTATNTSTNIELERPTEHALEIGPVQPRPRTPLPLPLPLPLPHLSSIYVGQVTFLRPAEVAMLALEPALAALTRVRVVDAYGGNIWGARVRLGDVEKAVVDALALRARGTTATADASAGDEQHVQVEEVVLNAYVDRVRRLVSCEALTERIIGGDRMDNSVH